MLGSQERSKIKKLQNRRLYAFIHSTDNLWNAYYGPGVVPITGDTAQIKTKFLLAFYR